jgi:hypothetical protein
LIILSGCKVLYIILAIGKGTLAKSSCRHKKKKKGSQVITAAAEHRADTDLTLTDTYYPEYLNVPEVEAEPETPEAERQALNARMAGWYGM